MSEKDLTPIQSYPSLQKKSEEEMKEETIPTPLDGPAFDPMALEPEIGAGSPVFESPAIQVHEPPSTPPEDARVLDQIKEYSEALEPNKPTVPAAYPFSLMIEGKLSESDQEKLMEFLSQEGFEIRQVDLEVQLQEERILIPRISEFAGVVLVQKFRDCGVTFKFGPAAEIFESELSREDGPPLAPETLGPISEIEWDSSPHPADKIAVLSDFKILSTEWTALDSLTASATLKTQMVEAERSPEFERLLEALRRELKFKAHRLGANAIFGFKLNLLPLATPTHYRMVVEGTAVRRGELPRNPTQTEF